MTHLSSTTKSRSLDEPDTVADTDRAERTAITRITKNVRYVRIHRILNLCQHLHYTLVHPFCPYAIMPLSSGRCFSTLQIMRMLTAVGTADLPPFPCCVWSLPIPLKCPTTHRTLGIHHRQRWGRPRRYFLGSPDLRRQFPSRHRRHGLGFPDREFFGGHRVPNGLCHRVASLGHSQVIPMSFVQ